MQYILKNQQNTAKKIDYAQELNPAQLKAVQKLNGPLLVIAGAGTGKTKTLVYRVANLIENGIAPEEILLLTFTRKAALEMLKKASLILDERCRQVSGGTFHSFANLLLRKYALLLGFNPRFTIIDKSDAEDLIASLKGQIDIPVSGIKFPTKGTLLKIFSHSINHNCQIAQSIQKICPQFTCLRQEINELMLAYDKHKQAHSIMDYDDLLRHFHRLLTDHAEVKAQINSLYRYVLIDEYQDTNLLQGQISQILAGEKMNIMAVGDDAQSIYGFRGARVQNMLDFPQTFPQTEIIRLEQNYRSTQPILNLANQVLSDAKAGFQKKLFTKVEGEEKPVLITSCTVSEQAGFVSQHIQELHKTGIPLQEIAVLFRSAWQANELELELQKQNIVFHKYGGIKFIETAHTKDIIAYLRILFNPLDSISWRRVLLLIEGVGEKTAQRIIATVKGQISQNLADSYNFTPCSTLDNKKFTPELRRLFDLFRVLATEISSPTEKLNYLLEYYQPFLEKHYNDYQWRQPDLNSLLAISSRYNTIEELLTDFALEPPENNQPKNNDFLTLSTIHSAKGLEWQIVFLIASTDGCLPSYRSVDNEAECEEERRLFYVAITRAKKSLYLICPQMPLMYENSCWSQMASGQPSRFLNTAGITNKLLQQWLLVEDKKKA